MVLEFVEKFFLARKRSELCTTDLGYGIRKCTNGKRAKVERVDESMQKVQNRCESLQLTLQFWE